MLPPIYLTSDNLRTFHTILGVGLHETVLGMCLANIEFSPDPESCDADSGSLLPALRIPAAQGEER